VVSGVLYWVTCYQYRTRGHNWKLQKKQSQSERALKTPFLCPNGRVATGEGQSLQPNRHSFSLGDDVVVAKCISNLKNKAALDTQKGTNLGLKCVKMRLVPQTS